MKDYKTLNDPVFLSGLPNKFFQNFSNFFFQKKINNHIDDNSKIKLLNIVRNKTQLKIKFRPQLKLITLYCNTYKH